VAIRRYVAERIIGKLPESEIHLANS
jgi:hypothetical protein